MDRTYTLLALTFAASLVACSEDTVPALDASGSLGLDAGLQLGDSSFGAPAEAGVSSDAGTLRADATVSSADAGPPARVAATSHMFEVLSEPHLQEAPYFEITRPKDLSVLGAPLPVIVWANGGCLRLDVPWQSLFQRWAAAGFVVLSLSANPDGDLTGGVIGSFAMTTDADHAALIDWVVAQSKAGPYAGKLDLSRIVLAGNSCGGVTALQAAAKDKRAAAVYVLSGSSALASVDSAVMSAISIPVGYTIGGDEDIAGANARGDYAVMRDGVPAMIVNRRTGDHFTVSSDPAVLVEEAEIALNWMDLALYGTRQAYEALTSANVCGKCTAGDWTLLSKHLETLRK